MNHHLIFFPDGYVISDPGHKRPNNEDNFLLDGIILTDPNAASRQEARCSRKDGNWHLAGVFDGMGGGEKGELASLIAAEAFRKGWEALGGCIKREAVDDLMKQCFQDANNRILELQKRYRIYGTTGTVVCSSGTEFKIYHLGDSRAYLLRKGELFPLTKDQTLAQLKKDRGRTTVEPIDHHTLTAYIGCDPSGNRIRPAESQWIPIQKGDRLLLCSDGLYDMCNISRICDIMKRASTPREAAESLTEAALTNGGGDNITCFVADFQGRRKDNA